MSHKRGLFIVFEGGDSVGKSTQVRLLVSWLQHQQIAYTQTHEPGDTWLGREIRRLVLGHASGDVAPWAEALLYAADKAQHLHEVVRPALEAGDVVVCDRYVDSMLAYQGAGRVLDLDSVTQVARWATDGLRPDLTVLLDADPAQAVEVIRDKDRLESAGTDFHRRARSHFLDLAAEDPAHYLVLPARDSREAIAAAVQGRVSELLKDLRL